MEYWKFYRDGKEEKVSPEVWQWEAVYSDGEILKQFDDSGIFHQFKEIDQSRLFAFKMLSSVFPHSYTLLFEEGMKLIHFYYRYCFRAKTPQEKKFTVYCFGYQKKKEKKIFMIMPNGELVITSDSEKVRVEEG